MKKILCFFLLLISTFSFSQNKGITYQAVIYAPGGQNIPGANIANVPMANKIICLQFSFLDASSVLEYQEEVKTKTDEFGMVNITIGSGDQSRGYANSFGDIVWNTSKNKTLQISLDATGLCKNFDLLSSERIASVPFANAAATTENISGIVAISNGGTAATTAAVARTNLGIGNVENTADLNKPMSTAAKTYIDSQLISNATVDATATTKGKIQLAGDLSGTADAPLVPGLTLKENVANKSFNIITDATSTTKYPSVKAIKDYVDTKNAAASVADGTITSAKIADATIMNLDVAANAAIDFSKLNIQKVDVLGLGIVKADLGLSNVDNTTDMNKPLSTATQAALNLKANSADVTSSLALKANLASPAFTGTVSGIDKTMVGLSNVNNTTDAAKPISTATQIALDLKANLASPAFTGTVSGIDKTMVGLSNVNNTTDTAKPISTATQIALDLKANLSSPTFTGTVGGITKSMVGLANVDNTTDLNKPISAATQTALNLKANAADLTISLALKEDAANKSTMTTLGTSDLLYPSQKAVKTYIDTAIAGATIVDADATTKGKIQLAGDLAGTAAAPTVPGLALKEEAANKSTTTTLGTSDLLYPSQKAVKTYVDTAIAGATIVDADATKKGKIQLAGDLAGTAAAPTVPGLALKEEAANKSTTTTLGTSDLLYPSQKAVKTYVDSAIAGATIADADATTKGKLKLAGDFVGTADLPEIATSAVTSTKILDGTIAVNDIANDAIETTKIKDANVTYAKLQNITTGKVLGRVSTGAGVVEEIATTGSGNVVRASSPTLVTPALGTPSAAVLTNATGLPLTSGITGVLAITNGGTGATNAAAALINLGAEAAVNKSTAVDLGNSMPSDLLFPSQAAVKAYVDSSVSSGAPDATTILKGKIQLAGDLTGTADLPVVANNAITTAKILDANVTDAKIATVSGSKVTGNISGNAATVTTNANLTGMVSSVGNATTVVTNANLTGEVTSTGNATTVTNAAVIGKVITGFTAGSGTVAATDTILQAIQKVDGNNALKAPLASPTFTGIPAAPTAAASTNTTQVATTAFVTSAVTTANATNADLTGPISSVGNTTSVASQTGTGSKFVMDTSPTLVTPVLGVATATSINSTSIPTSKTLVVTTDKLNILAATTSAELAGVVSDETGTGTLVLSASPTFTGTPTLPTGTIGVTQTAGDSTTALATTAFVTTANATNANLTGMVTSVGNATTVVTNANLTGAITSSGNATSLGSFTSANLASALSDETGSGVAVLATSPTLVTPVLGVATATSINSTSIPTSKTLVVTTDKLNVLAATTSAELAGVVSDETGTGTFVLSASPTFTGTPTLPTGTIGVTQTAGNNTTALATTAFVTGANATNANLTGPITSVGNTTSVASQTGTGSKFVMDTSPTLVTPVLGVATATSINSTTIPTSKTLVVTTDKLNVLAATTSAELAGVVSDETGTGALVFATNPALITPTIGVASATSVSFAGATSGNATLVAPVVAGTTTITLPAATGTLATLAGTETLTNKTLTSPTLTAPVLGTPASGTLTNATGLPIATGISGLGTGVATALATPSSANVLAAVTDETGTGALVFATSPTLVTPALGVATATSINGLTPTAQTTGFTIAGGTTSKTLTVSNDATVSGSNTGDQTTINGNAGTATKLATARKINTVDFDGSADITVTADATTLSGTSLKSTIVSSSLTSVGTLTNLTVTNAIAGSITGNAATVTNGIYTTSKISDLAATTSAELAGKISDEIGTGVLVFATSPTLITPTIGVASATSVGFAGATSGNATLAAPAVAGTTTITLPAATGTLATLAGTETLTNKTLTSPTMTAPVLGTPASGTLTNATGLPIATGVSGLGTGVATALATPSSANVLAAVTDETGTGALVFATSPTLVTPALGTPTSGTLTNATGLPIATGISGLGTGVATALATPSSANLIAAVTDETGTGALVFATSPTMVTPALGTPSAAVLTNATGLPLTSGVIGTLPIANGGTGQITKTAAFDALSPMTTAGDIIYGGTSGTGTRLAKGTDGQVLTLASGLPSWSNSGGTIATMNASGNASATASYIIFTGSTASSTITVPSAVTLGAGREITIKNVASVTVSIASAGGFLIQDSLTTSGTSAALGVEPSNNWMKLVSDGTNWYLFRALF